MVEPTHAETRLVEKVPQDMPEAEARDIADMLLAEIREINDQIENALLQSNAGLNVDNLWLRRAFRAKRAKKEQMRAYLRHADMIVRSQRYDASNRRLHERIEKMARKHKASQLNLMNSAKAREESLVRKLNNIRRAAEEYAACVGIARNIVLAHAPDAYDSMIEAFKAAQFEIREKFMNGGDDG